VTSSLTRAGFDIAPLQNPQFSSDIDLAAPESWDLTVQLPDRRKIVGANAYRHVMRRVSRACGCAAEHR
jgi:hypothetical protein